MSLDLSYATAFGSGSPDAYERLLMDVIRGNPTLFMRRDEVEAAWTWVAPILDRWSRPRPTGPGRTRPARTDPSPPSRSSSATADPGRRPNEYPSTRSSPRSPTASHDAARPRARPTSPASDAAMDTGPARGKLACANLAHGFAAADEPVKSGLQSGRKPNVAIVSSYNDMLSAHQPFRDVPEVLKKSIVPGRRPGAVRRGVPAMCDGITQGRAGMELSLFSRDLIAMSTAVALSHDMFDAAMMLGVCDKIVPGLLIGALSFGHLPTVFVPAGPMTSGLPNGEKARVRQLYAEGKVGREELLEAESASYHSKGTCTFYGTANSNQMLMEVMGLHLPDATFVNPGTPLRAALDRAAGERAVAITRSGGEPTPVGHLVDEKAIVNACVALLATGGSTNHTMHLVAIAAAAGITLTWDDLSDLSAAVPLLTRIYPNGSADINHFVAAGGTPFLVHTLLKHGYLHDDVLTVSGRGLWRHTREARLDGVGDTARVVWEEGPDVVPRHRGAALRGPAVRRGRRTADAVGTPRPRRGEDLRGQARAPRRDGARHGLRRPGRASWPPSPRVVSTTATSSPSCATRGRQPTACPSSTS